MAGPDAGHTPREAVSIDSGTVLRIGSAWSGYNGISIGLGAIINLLHSTGNAMVVFDPNYGGAGYPGMKFYNSAGSALLTMYSDGTWFYLGGTLKLRESDGAVYVAGMRTHRHPYTTDRHIESGQHSFASGGSFSVTFTDAFASAPAIPTGDDGANNTTAQSATTTGFTLAKASVGLAYWIAEGQD